MAVHDFHVAARTSAAFFGVHGLAWSMSGETLLVCLSNE